jgi:holo-[acyl-carrier protein] synthase
MIVGIGVDLVKIERFKLDDERFIKRVLSEDEITLMNARRSHRRKLEFIAGRFAVKEAFLKALGEGIGNLPLKEIEVLADVRQKPYIKYQNYNVQVSITHTETDACGFVVIEK